MRFLYTTIISLISFLSTFGQNSFTGQSGVYYLGTANIPISTAVYSNPNISGVVVRFNWNDVETSPGVFNWDYVDGEIAKATSYGKKASLQPLGEPNWMAGLGVQQYYYVDNNTFHPTYGQVVSSSIVWDAVYVSRYQNLLQAMAAKYANNTTVAYVNTIGGSFSRGLPATVITDTTTLTTAPFYTAFPYNADTLASLINTQIDYYMSLFPSTPLWCSVDYVSFETSASGHERNYLATLYTNYGITNYPNRFGLWREDLSGCNPQSTIPTGNQWYIMQQNPCRTGAQLLWNVQDGPTRMNQCGLIPNTKQAVLDYAVQKGLSLGMRYLEIYGIDIQDTSLSTNIQQANSLLIAQGNSCNALGIDNNASENENKIYPNPTSGILKIDIKNTTGKSEIEIFNSLGQSVFKNTASNETEINISTFASGIYFVKIQNGQNILTKKIVKE